MLNIPAGSTGRMTKQRAPQVDRVERADKPAKAKSEAPQKSAEPRVKRERTRTKRITS